MKAIPVFVQLRSDADGGYAFRIDANFAGTRASDPCWPYADGE